MSEAQAATLIVSELGDLAHNVTFTRAEWLVFQQHVSRVMYEQALIFLVIGAIVGVIGYRVGLWYRTRRWS